MEYRELREQIQSLHDHLLQKAVKAINIHLTFRNWVIGMYIVEFEQNGSDRADYGTKLLERLSNDISIKGLTAPELSRCRQFYQCYPAMFGTLSQELENILPKHFLGTLSQELVKGNQKLPDHYYYSLVTNLSYSHFIELLKIQEDTQRTFYEMIAMKNTLSVRELKRQISTLAYERVGLSSNIESAEKELARKLRPAKAADAVKSIYLFDFLNLPGNHLIQEDELESLLIRNLEQFILELGNGFCFEARQKRMLIDDEYYFVDLVFYHRILKCHVLIDLKIDKFKHEYLSQLNSYVAYYNDRERLDDDNPAIGILLCTEKGKQMVEYAMAGMHQKLFVSKYQLQLPSKEKLLNFIQNELNNF